MGLEDSFDSPRCSQYRLAAAMARSPVKPTRLSPLRKKVCPARVCAKADPERWNAASLGLNVCWVQVNEKVAAGQELGESLHAELEMLEGLDPDGVQSSQEPKRLQEVLAAVDELARDREEEWETYWSMPGVSCFVIDSSYSLTSCKFATHATSLEHIFFVENCRHFAAF